MDASANLRKLIDSNAPYWAGEAEVFRTYWTWDKRTRETDKTWLRYQCFKEIWGSGVGDANLGLFMGPVKQLEAWFPEIDKGVDRHEVLDMAEGLWAEFAHYCAFADAFDGMLIEGEDKMTPAATYSWPEDDVLGTLRYKHRDEHGELGRRASNFTEGGYCTLFSEGMALGRNSTAHDGRDALIAEACSKVYDDEFGHMLKGIAGLDKEGLSTEEWELMERLTTEQLRLRIEMRNAQFGKPLSDARVAEIQSGKATPLAFDYASAATALAA